MKDTVLGLLCMLMICLAAVACTLIHSEYNRYSFIETSGKTGFRLDKRSGNVWWIYFTKATLVEDKTRPRQAGVIWDDEKPAKEYEITDQPTE